MLLALVVLQTCHAGSVAGTGCVTKVSRGWCCWFWYCYKSVTRVVLGRRSLFVGPLTVRSKFRNRELKFEIDIVVVCSEFENNLFQSEIQSEPARASDLSAP